jgi:hypothetical protein
MLYGTANSVISSTRKNRFLLGLLQALDTGMGIDIMAHLTRKGRYDSLSAAGVLCLGALAIVDCRFKLSD